MPEVSKEQISFLKAVLTSQLLLEANEELVLTKQYRNDLKQQINRVNRMLESIVRESFDTIYSTDPEMTTNILNKIDSIIGKVSKFDVDELVIVDSVINKYIDNKKWFLDHAESEFLNID